MELTPRSGGASTLNIKYSYTTTLLIVLFFARVKGVVKTDSSSNLCYRMILLCILLFQDANVCRYAF